MLVMGRVLGAAPILRSTPPAKHSPLSAASPSTRPRPVPLLTPRLSGHLQAPSTANIATPLPSTMSATTAVINMPPATLVTPSRKRKIIVDSPTTTATMGHKRMRTWTELEYEEMLQEATLLREELELLVAVAADLCRDLACDPSHVRSFMPLLKLIDEKMTSTEDITERQVREMCQQMITMMKYLCQSHYHHFALVDMQDHLRECRDRFMRFICQYAAMIGLFR